MTISLTVEKPIAVKTYRFGHVGAQAGCSRPERTGGAMSNPLSAAEANRLIRLCEHYVQLCPAALGTAVRLLDSRRGRGDMLEAGLRKAVESGRQSAFALSSSKGFGETTFA